MTTNDDALAERARLLRGQGMDPERRYFHTVVGYNYRMTNIQAAIGCAQLQNAEWHIAQRLRIASHYTGYLRDCSALTLPVQQEWAKNVYWLFSVVLREGSEAKRDEVIRWLELRGSRAGRSFIRSTCCRPTRSSKPRRSFRSRAGSPLGVSIFQATVR